MTTTRKCAARAYHGFRATTNPKYNLILQALLAAPQVTTADLTALTAYAGLPTAIAALRSRFTDGRGHVHLIGKRGEPNPDGRGHTRGHYSLSPTGRALVLAAVGGAQ